MLQVLFLKSEYTNDGTWFYLMENIKGRVETSQTERLQA